jgi:hypothetical protein
MLPDQGNKFLSGRVCRCTIRALPRLCQPRDQNNATGMPIKGLEKLQQRLNLSIILKQEATLNQTADSTGVTLRYAGGKQRVCFAEACAGGRDSTSQTVIVANLHLLCG